MELRFNVINELPGLPRLVHATPSEYFKAIDVNGLERWRGRLYVETHRGGFIAND